MEWQACNNESWRDPDEGIEQIARLEGVYFEEAEFRVQLVHAAAEAFRAAVLRFTASLEKTTASLAELQQALIRHDHEHQ